MRLGRYHQSPASTNFLQTSNKITPRRLGHSATKNPELTADSMKLPALSGSMMMRSSAVSLGSDRNTKNRLNLLANKLDELQSQIHNARMDANETYNHMQFLRQQLLQKQLSQSNQDMKGQIQGLRKLVQITKSSHQQRSSDLREDYIQLWNQTQEMREMIFSLTTRTDKIEDAMGMKNL